MDESYIQIIRDWLWPIVGVLIAIAIIWVVKKMIKLPPPLEINLTRELPFTHFDQRREKIFFEKNPQYKQDEIRDMTFLSASKENYYFDIDWRQWHTSINDFKRIMARGYEQMEKQLEHISAGNNKFIGTWFFDFIEANKVWLILHFQDDYFHSEWCYCKQFKYDPKYEYYWRIERKQYRKKLTGLRIPAWRNPCKCCSFRNKLKKEKL